MSESIHIALRDAILRLFRPLARILIRNGVPYGTFAEWTKKVYVDVAYRDFATPGKKQTISMVSALTGIFRRDAKRLHEMKITADDRPNERYNRAIRVISGWKNDPLFLDDNGLPLPLPKEGDVSFSELIKRYSGDITVKAMLAVLADSDTIEINPEGLICLVKPAYIPGNDPVDKIGILGTDVSELASAIDHNLTAKPEQLVFQRKVSTSAISPETAKEFEQLASQKAQALLEELDLWLSQRELTPEQLKQTDTEKRYVGLGIYYTDYDPEREEDHERPE
jgi:hypothetical protein